MWSYLLPKQPLIPSVSHCHLTSPIFFTFSSTPAPLAPSPPCPHLAFISLHNEFSSTCTTESVFWLWLIKEKLVIITSFFFLLSLLALPSALSHCAVAFGTSSCAHRGNSCPHHCWINLSGLTLCTLIRKTASVVCEGLSQALTAPEGLVFL